MLGKEGKKKELASLDYTLEKASHRHMLVIITSICLCTIEVRERAYYMFL